MSTIYFLRVKLYMKYILLVLSILFLGIFTSCQTPNLNTPGQITDRGVAGETSVVGVGNAETPASLDRQENTFTINHKDGDMLVIEGEGPALFDHIIKIVGENKNLQLNDKNEMVDPTTTLKNNQFENWTITYKPKTGATTQITGINVKASTGNSRVDIAAKTRETLKNTKTIQYVGIGFLIVAAAWGFIFKTPFQALIIGGIGIGLIILQATLANPIWSWVMVLLVLGLPAFWIYHYLSRKKEGETLERVIPKVDEFVENNPESGQELLNLLGRSMNDKHKKVIKNKKQQLSKTK